MSKVIKVYSKEGTIVEISEESARTSKYFLTVLKEDPDCQMIQTNIPSSSLEIAKKFCNLHFAYSLIFHD